MAFVLNLNVNGGNAVATVNQVQAGLGKATAATGQARNAMGQFTAGAQAAGAAGAKAGEDTARGMERASAATSGSSDALSTLIHLTEAYIGIHVAESIIDGYVEIRNKTNSVATSAANLNALMDEQFHIAQDTRSSWEGLASTYQRISNAGRGLGLSQRAIIDLTRELSQGLRLSGSSAFEANMTMMELTHAFTVGALTGREFRVMMKDAPALMHELQVVSGKTGAEFAEMGKHGKFTAQQLIEWFDKAKVTIADKFGQTIPTISEGFLLIRNAAQKFFGEAGLGTGVVQGLGTAMRYVAEHFETVGKVTLAVVEALLGLFVIEKIIVLVRALTLAIAANPLGAILTALTVGIALLRQFGYELNTNQKIWANVEGQFVTVGDQLFAIWEMIKRLAGAIGDFIDGAWHKLTDAFDNGVNGDGIELSLRNVLTFMASFVDAAIGIFKFLNDMIVTIFGGIPTVITQAFVDLARGAISVVETLVNTIIDAVNKVIGAYESVRALLPGNQKTPDEESRQQRAFAERWAGEMNTKYNLNISPVGATQEEQERRAAGMQAALTAGLHPTTAGFAPAQAPGGYKRESEGGLIPRVDLDFKNPLEGASQVFLKKFGQDWKEDLNDTTVAKDMVNALMDEVDKSARDHAARRVFGAPINGEVSTVGGTPDAKLPNEKEAKAAAKAYEKLESQLRTITEASNPQSAAVEKLAHAHEVLEKAISAVNPKTHEHLITVAAATQVYDNLRAKLEDQLHPFDAWVRKQQEATAALRDTNEAQERAARLTAFAAEMRQKTGGLEVDPAELAAAERQIAISARRVEIMHAEQEVTQATLGPQHTYQVQLAAIADLLDRGRINADQYNHAIDEARAAYLAASEGTRTFGQLAEAAWLKAKEEARAAGVAVESYGRVVDEARAKQLAAGPEGRTFGGAMEAEWLKAKMAAEDFGATLATTLVSDLDKVNDAIITMASNGEVSFRRLIGSMLEELAKLALKMLEVRALGALFNSFGGGAGEPDKIGLANQMAEAMGFSTGGTAMVGGNGGTDSQLIALRATPGERLTVQTPTQQNSQAAPPASDVHLKVVNQIDPNDVHAAMDSPEGERIFMNFLRRNPGAVRSYSGTRK